MRLHPDAATGEPDSFHLQANLLVKPGLPWQCDPSPRPKDAMPWKLKGGGSASQGPTDLTGRTRWPNGLGDITVGSDEAPWDAPNHLPDSFSRWFRL